MIYDPKLRDALLAKGLTKQQVNSPVAEKMVEIFGDAKSEDTYSLLADELSAKTTELAHRRHDIELRIEETLRKLQERIEQYGNVITSVVDAQKDYGDLTDERAKNAISLFASMVYIGRNFGRDIDKTIESAGYVVYAYLGGQATRNIVTASPEMPRKKSNFYDED